MNAKPSIGAVILSRMSSNRLPGKALHEIDGTPLLGHVIERCRKVRGFGQRIIVATSRRPDDDAIASYCQESGVDVFRGDLDDVAERALGAANRMSVDWFARVNGDSPFLDPAVLDTACDIAASAPVDYVTNLAPRTFPYGVSAELLRTEAFSSLLPSLDSTRLREHVTLYHRENLGEVPHRNILRQGEDLSHVRLVLDTPSDIEFCNRLHRELDTPFTHVTYVEAAAFALETASQGAGRIRRYKNSR